MKAVLNKENGLRSSDLLSHVGVFETPHYHKLLFVTDGGLNIAPDINKKVSIINNAVKLTKALGIEKPKIAGLCAIELVNQDMPATIDAALLTMMNKRGQLKDCIFEGPLAMDNAVSSESAKIKGIESSISGDVDILLVPDIEAGNMVVKALTYLAGASWGGIVLGAKCPIVLVSRADSYEAKLYSIAIAVAMAE
jgi:phosphotransacetylase